MRARASTIALLSLAACASAGKWEWRRTDGSPYDEDQLQEDIDACEEYAVVADSGRADRGTTSRARPRGGWGNFSFEFCMHERKWELKQAKPEGERTEPAR